MKFHYVFEPNGDFFVSLIGGQPCDFATFLPQGNAITETTFGKV